MLRLEDELRECGSTVDPDAVKDAVLEVYLKHFGQRTSEDLVCDTPAAARYVKLVRQRLGCRKVPALTINRTLFSLRKQSRLPAGRRKRAVTA
jgi:hypothetical protein